VAPLARFVAFAALLGVAACTSLPSPPPAAPIGTTQMAPSDRSPELQPEVAEARKLDNLPPVTPHGHATIDHSGRKQAGRALFYADRFADRKMADGRSQFPSRTAQ